MMGKDEIGLLVNICGANLPVKGNFKPEYIRKIAEILDSRMREVERYFPTKSLEKTAMLTALNLEDELFTLEEEKRNLLNQLEKRAKHIIEQIEKILADTSS